MSDASPTLEKRIEQFAHLLVASLMHREMNADSSSAAAASNATITTLASIFDACGRAVARGGDLWDPDTEDATGGAGRPGPDADQECPRSDFHELERGLVGDTVADDDGDLHRVAEALEIQRLVVMRDVLHSDHRGLHHEEGCSGFLGDRPEALRPLRDGADDGGGAALLDLLDALGDQPFLDWLEVGILDQAGGFLRAGFRDALDDLLRMLIPGLDPFQVEDRQAPEPSHLDRKRRIHNPIHR